MNHLRDRSQHGMALPLALLLLVMLGFAGSAAAFMSNTETRISSSYSASNSALGAAQAAADHGVAELSARYKAGQDPDSLQIVSESLGRFTYTVTVYSKREASSLPGGDDGGGAGHDYNGDGDKTDVVFYDKSFGYTQATAAGGAVDPGAPVKILVAEATDGRSKAQVRVEVAADKADDPTTLINSAMTLSSPSNSVLSGNFDLDGRLYRRDGTLVPSNSLTPGYGSDATSRAAAKTQCDYWKPAIKIPVEGSLGPQGDFTALGHVSFDHPPGPNYDQDDPLATFKFTPEELLGVKLGALDSYKKPASAVPDFRNLSGVNYVTSGNVPSQISGSGILIVHNPKYDVKKYDCTNFSSTCIPGYSDDPANQPMAVQINANGNFNGIVIVDKIFKLNGDFNVLGAIISLTTEQMNLPGNGGGGVKYSCEMIQDVIKLLAPSYDTRLAWEHRLQ